MFNLYSKRAIQVVFVTRSKAGERGSGTLDIGDFVLAFVLEDQGKMGDVLHQPSPGDVVIDELEAHVPFLQPEAAARLLLSVENVLTHSTPVPTRVGLSVSAELYEVFQFAEELRKELGHEHIELLHLLAGVAPSKIGIPTTPLIPMMPTSTVVPAPWSLQLRRYPSPESKRAGPFRPAESRFGAESKERDEVRGG